MKSLVTASLVAAQELIFELLGEFDNYIKLAA